MSAVTDLLVNAILNWMDRGDRAKVLRHATERAKILLEESTDPLVQAELQDARAELIEIKKKLERAFT